MYTAFVVRVYHRICTVVCLLLCCARAVYPTFLAGISSTCYQLVIRGTSSWDVFVDVYTNTYLQLLQYIFLFGLLEIVYIAQAFWWLCTLHLDTSL
jgi:hypothetical protein